MAGTGIMIEVSCSRCKKIYDKERSKIPTWSGLCHSCACRKGEGARSNTFCIDCKSQLSTEYAKRCRRCAYIARRGIPLSPYALERAKQNHVRGDCHPNWKGGSTTERRELMNSLEYKTWRSAVFVRDDYICQECKAKSGQGSAVHLHADHIKPYATHKHLALDLDNGRTLCEDCHRQTPTYGVKMLYQ